MCADVRTGNGLVTVNPPLQSKVDPGIVKCPYLVGRCRLGSSTRRPRAMNVCAAASPFTPAPMTAAVSASARPSVSAASTAAAPVRKDVTAPASSTAFGISALTDTLILDEDGLYNPGHFNDRLLLGLKRHDS